MWTHQGEKCVKGPRYELYNETLTYCMLLKYATTLVKIKYV